MPGLPKSPQAPAHRLRRRTHHRPELTRSHRRGHDRATRTRPADPRTSARTGSPPEKRGAKIHRLSRPALPLVCTIFASRNNNHKTPWASSTTSSATPQASTSTPSARNTDAILYDGEQLETAFRIFRDKWVFHQPPAHHPGYAGPDGQEAGNTSPCPNRSISFFSIETAGTLDDDCELKLWLAGRNEPFTQEFSRDTDIRNLQKTLARHILEED